MDNGIMENFFGRLKVVMYYGENFEYYYNNNQRISLKLKGMSPVQYRTHSGIG